MSKEDKIGALWLNSSKSGVKYMSGSVTIDGVTTKLVVFKNNYKEKETHPDYVINKSKPVGAEAAAEPMKKVFQKDFEDDIPF
jgi:uncharacterized protein (DUF736 family)